MNVLAIDPGYEQSAWVLWEGGARIVEHAIESNFTLLGRINGGMIINFDVDAVVLEQIEGFGMAVGREVFETVFWMGRLFQACLSYGESGCAVDRMPRKTVKLHLCESARAQDTNIRTALMDRFGGKEAAIGKKKTPGPLFGIKSHEWSALAIAVTWHDTHKQHATERTA